MTIRQTLRNKLLKAIYAMIIGVILFISGFIVDASDGGPGKYPFIPLLGFSLIFVAQLYVYLFIKCPKCDEKIGHILLSTTKSIKMTTKVNYCPFCGTSLETDLNIPV